jgi:hypothetical protein
VFHQGDQVGYPVSRAGKQITLFACIGSDGSCTKPLVIIPVKTLDTDFRLTGLTSEKFRSNLNQKVTSTKEFLRNGSLKFLSRSSNNVAKATAMEERLC